MSELQYEMRGKNDDILCLVIEGWLDPERCDYLFGCIEHLLGASTSKLILDCSALQNISSVGLGMMVRVHSRMKRMGGEAKLAAVQGATAKVISLVQLDRVFEIYPTVEEAIEAYDR